MPSPHRQAAVPPKASGFSLVELLVVIAIIGTLAGLLLPAVQQTRASSRKVHCGNNMKQIGLALQAFHTSFEHYPLGEPDDDNNGWCWRFWILPFLEEQGLYDAAMGDPIPEYRPSISPKMGAASNVVNIDSLTFPQQATNTVTGSSITGGVAGQLLGIYLCPADTLPMRSSHSLGTPSYWGPFAKANYCGNIGSSPAWFAETGQLAGYFCGGSSPGPTVLQTSLWNGMLTFSNHNFANFAVRASDITDGTSKTVFVGEATASLNCNVGNLDSGVFPAWAGGPGIRPTSVTLTGPHGNNGNVNYCGYLPAVGSVFRFMDGNYPLNAASITAPSDNSFASQHAGGGNFLLADGSVRFIVDQIDSTVYQALGSRSGNEVQGLEW